MSRIPKIGSKAPTGNKDLKENKIDMATKKTSSNIAFKRPSDDLLSASEKRPRTNFSSIVKNKVVSSVQASDLQKKLATEQKFKRVALQPIPDTGLVRSSMPAVSTTKLKLPGKPKRAAWDLKGRIQDMEECFKASQLQNNTLEQELEAYNQRIAALETANSRLHKDVEIKSVQSEEATSQIHKLEVKLKQMTEEFESLSQEKEREVHKAQLLNQELTNLKMNYENLKISYQQEVSALTSSITSLTCMKSGIQAQLDAAQSLIAQLKASCEEKDSKIENLLQQVSDMNSKIRHEETVRRLLHNTIQELKGNIRVYCRLRPSLPEELKNGMNIANIVAVSDKTIELQQLPEVGLNESGGKANPKYEFSFDCFFPPSASQEQVFNEISQLVQSSLDGYNVCIFAYGQTGSGKTFTMEGPSDIIDFIANKNNPNLGMIPRSVQQIFSTIAELEPKGWKYKIQTLFLEIYNERIQDLLNAQSGNTKCEIIKSSNKGNDCIISNVTPVDVSSEEQVYELMKKARINRAVASTKCNEHSSRSHFVFQMKIRGENSITSEKCDATLNLVDLAGSERIKESESAGDRLIEAKAINKSLSNLGLVIMSLSKKESHIPYRDSKLTHLLANSLGGNSKTLMFVNISPDNKNMNETINSLRFATKVNQCVIGTAQKRLK